MHNLPAIHNSRAKYQLIVAFDIRQVGFKMVRSFSGLLLGAAFVLAISATSASAHFQVLYRFKASDGGSPSALILDEAGNFYGTTLWGGKGTVFKFAPDGTKTTLYRFSNTDSGAAPFASLWRDSAGNLYGTTQYTNVAGDKGGTVFKLSADGHETVLHRFTVNDPAGYMPRAELIADKSGNFYGTTTYGNSICDCGAVFKLAPDGEMTVLHAFTGGNDGAFPEGGLVFDKNGNLYGTASEGGPGRGIAFKIATDGTETILHGFGSDGNDGSEPWGTLIIGKDGNLYGTASTGGPRGLGGIVFKMTPDGTETVLYNFGLGQNDGENPLGALVMDAKGNLFGTTSAGGWACGCGTVFKITTDGREKTLRWFSFLTGRHGFVPHRVGGPHAGWSPSRGLTRDAAGNLYGTTMEGGAYKKGGHGTIFAIEK